MIFTAKAGIYNLETNLSETNADLIRWLFLFWTGQTAAVLAIVNLR